jgi:hypothetical protein
MPNPVARFPSPGVRSPKWVIELPAAPAEPNPNAAGYGPRSRPLSHLPPSGRVGNRRSGDGGAMPHSQSTAGRHLRCQLPLSPSTGKRATHTGIVLVGDALQRCFFSSILVSTARLAIPYSHALAAVMVPLSV